MLIHCKCYQIIEDFSFFAWDKWIFQKKLSNTLHSINSFNNSSILLQKQSLTHFSFPDPEPAGLRLLNAFNHFVFIDVDEAVDILRSPLGMGEPGSSLLKKSSFWNDRNNKKILWIKARKYFVI